MCMQLQWMKRKLIPLLSVTQKLKNATELSVVESACIYVKRRFGKFFCSKMKLLLALSEAITNEPDNESLMNAIRVMSGGVSKRMRDSYGINADVICVFKTVQDNM